MGDRLDRLERLGYLDATQGLDGRGVRNRLAHVHPDAPELRWSALDGALAAARAMPACWSARQQRLPD